MRHRAPTPLVRLLKTAPARRGIAAGTVLLLGASSAVYLAVSDEAGPGGDDPRVAADAPVGGRDGTSYPGAAALEAIRATRTPSSNRGSDREPLPGQARPRPSDQVSTGVMTPPAPTPSTTVPTRPAPSGATGPGADDDGPTASSDPTREAPPPTTAPTTPPSEPTPSSPPPSPTTPPAPTGPETTAVTQVVAAGTWTVALASNTGGASFQCSLDGAGYAPCGPLATFAGLRKGRHTLSARAVDSSGTADPSPVVLTTEVTGLL